PARARARASGPRASASASLRLLDLKASVANAISPCNPMTDTDISFDREVDARGLNCPLPILRAKKALADLQAGQVLKVVSTDPGSKRDFEAFARQTGHELLKLGAAGS